MAMFTLLVMVIISLTYEYFKIYQDCTLLNMCSHCMSISIKLLKLNNSGKIM